MKSSDFSMHATNACHVDTEAKNALMHVINAVKLLQTQAFIGEAAQGQVVYHS